MIKSFILNRQFVRRELEKATKKGSIDAFEKAREDLKETMVVDIEKKAETLAKEKMANMLGIFDESLVLTRNSKTGQIYIGGQLADEGRILNLKSEAESLSQSELWKLINSSVDDIARKIMFEKSETIDDLKTGKSVLYTLSLQNNILKTLKEYKNK